MVAIIRHRIENYLINLGFYYTSLVVMCKIFKSQLLFSVFDNSLCKRFYEGESILAVQRNLKNHYKRWCVSYF